MPLDTLFTLSNATAMLGWLLLVTVPRWRHTATLITSALIPLLLAGIYATLMAANWGSADGGGFGSIAEIQTLFQVPGLFLAGWLHYLAFDLFIGSWQVRDAQAQAIPHLLVIPCLLLTLFFGPIGLASYLILRAVYTRQLHLADPC